jgi:hypothetical protein
MALVTWEGRADAGLVVGAADDAGGGGGEGSIVSQSAVTKSDQNRRKAYIVPSNMYLHGYIMVKSRKKS